MRNHLQDKKLFSPLADRRGQSAVEYLVVVSALIFFLLAAPSIYKTFSLTMQYKYKSYAFGVSISDPPSKHFDDEVKGDIDRVNTFVGRMDLVLQEVYRVIKKIKDGKPPGKDDLKKILKLIKNLFH